MVKLRNLEAGSLLTIPTKNQAVELAASVEAGVLGAGMGAMLSL